MNDVLDVVALNRDHDRRCKKLIEQAGPAWWAARQQQDRDAYRNLLEHVPVEARGKTLELGAGNGKGYSLLLEMGFVPLIGLELLPEHADAAKRDYSVETWVGAMEALPSLFPAGEFDVVTSRHTLEHTSAPGTTIEGIGKVLKRGGYTAHAVPAFDGMQSEPAHLTNWLWEAWCKEWKRHGFELVWAQYVLSYADPELQMVWRKAE